MKGLLGLFLLFALASAGKGTYVCTETFKAGLTSFFVQRDSKVAFAQDQSELCELCAKITRLGYLFANDVQTVSTWDRALQDSACAYVSDRRRADCQTLARAVTVSQKKHFDGKDSKFTPKELRGSTEQLSLLVDKKSYDRCRQMGCCPIAPKPGKDDVVRPCDKKGDARDIEKDLKASQQDRFYLNKLREELFIQRRDNNAQKAKQDLHEIDLKGREDKLKKEQLALKAAQEKLKEANAALKRREDRFKRHEEDIKKKDEWLKKYEKNIKIREDLVTDREEAAYRREEKLDIPHPPKKIPGAPPPPPPPEPKLPTVPSSAERKD